MANDSSSEWWTIGWDIAKYVMAALGATASGIVLWFGRKGSGYVAMLLAHEQWIKGHEPELGEQKAFQVNVRKEMQAIVDKQETVNRKLHGRIARRKSEHGALQLELASKLTRIETMLDTLVAQNRDEHEK